MSSSSSLFFYFTSRITSLNQTKLCLTFYPNYPHTTIPGHRLSSKIARPHVGGQFSSPPLFAFLGAAKEQTVHVIWMIKRSRMSSLDRISLCLISPSSDFQPTIQFNAVGFSGSHFVPAFPRGLSTELLFFALPRRPTVVGHGVIFTIPVLVCLSRILHKHSLWPPGVVPSHLPHPQRPLICNEINARGGVRSVSAVPCHLRSRSVFLMADCRSWWFSTARLGVGSSGPKPFDFAGRPAAPCFCSCPHRQMWVTWLSPEHIFSRFNPPGRVSTGVSSCCRLGWGSELKGCWLDVVFFLLGVWWPMRSVENGPQVNNQLWTLHHSVPFGAGEETLDYGGEKRCVELYV